MELENVMYGVMSRELVREQAMIGMLGALSAEARVARFLVSLADRFAAMGYSSKLFNLRMTRHEIGSYLGLTLETVSRTLSAFNEIGLITVDQRTIGIKDAEALQDAAPPAAVALAHQRRRRQAEGRARRGRRRPGAGDDGLTDPPAMPAVKTARQNGSFETVLSGPVI